MAYSITVTQFTTISGISSGKAQEITDAINASLARFELDGSSKNIQYFIAQAASATQNFSCFSVQNSYPYPESLATIYPDTFFYRGLNRENRPVSIGQGQLDATVYVNDSEKVCNAVYANTEGNGDEASGDGWKYRPRGPLNLAYRSNYGTMSFNIYNDDRLVQDPDLVSDYTDAFNTLAWYWKTNSLSILAAAGHYNAITEKLCGKSNLDLRAAQVDRNRYLSIVVKTFFIK